MGRSSWIIQAGPKYDREADGDLTLGHAEEGSDVKRGTDGNDGAAGQEVPAASRGWKKQATILP